MLNYTDFPTDLQHPYAAAVTTLQVEVNVDLACNVCERVETEKLSGWAQAIPYEVDDWVAARAVAGWRFWTPPTGRCWAICPRCETPAGWRDVTDVVKERASA